MARVRIAISAPEGTDITVFSEPFGQLGAECSLFSRSEENACDFSGLLVPGGPDVDPRYYGQSNFCSSVDPALDELQLAALDSFVRMRKPVFGICRGQQLINVYFGGSLIQHLPNAEKHMRINGTDNVHELCMLPDCFLPDIFKEFPVVNSSHHQAVDRPGNGIQIAAYDSCGVAEAIYHETLPVYGVQFHPERMCLSHARPDTADGLPVLGFFVKLCKEFGKAE